MFFSLSCYLVCTYGGYTANGKETEMLQVILEQGRTKNKPLWEALSCLVMKNQLKLSDSLVSYKGE